MTIKIALAGNPNCGKTTLFNALTGANQFVGNWPGVTVEKKEGRLKKHDNVIITDLPGIYSLSPYTLEEVVARNYIIDEEPDVILNIVDGTNIERNLYLTTQLTELGIPVVIAINMMDVVKKNGDKININLLSKKLGCPVYEISALKGNGIIEVAEAAVKAACEAPVTPSHSFSGPVEHAIAHIEEAVLNDLPDIKQRFYAIKLFERDERIINRLSISQETLDHIEKDITSAEAEINDDAESIIANDRYIYISEVVNKCCKKKSVNKLTISDKIDKIITNRWLGLPIFAIIMFFVYYVSITTVGGQATDFVNDNVFGEGWHLFGIGSESYSEANDEYTGATEVINAFASVSGDETLTSALDAESEDYDGEAAVVAVNSFASMIDDKDFVTVPVQDDETLLIEDVTYTGAELHDAAEVFAKYNGEAVEASDYGIFIPSIPDLVSGGLQSINAAPWLHGLIVDGIVAGVGAVLGFVPQILVLFIFLAFLEACGYMARVAFVMDRIFRKFGLSGKSFISYLIGTGCGIPGIMASRTIENEKDRRMTIMTTTFMPCGAKLPFIALMTGAIFGGSPWVAPFAYFLGIFAVVISGIVLKKTKAFAGDPAPFVMELPAYHLPTFGTVLRSMWERGWSFIKKAGTIILISTIAIWFLSRFGWVDGSFGMLAEEEIGNSMLSGIGNALSIIFAPLGWGNWQASVAAITGLVAKENIVATLGILYTTGEAAAVVNIGMAFTAVTGLSFLVFNLLCAPCFAAIGAIKREMNNRKWFWAAIGYQCGFAYIIAFIIAQFGYAATGIINIAGFIIAVILCFLLIYGVLRPYNRGQRFIKSVSVK